MPASSNPVAIYHGLIGPHLVAVLIGTLLTGFYFSQVVSYYTDSYGSSRRRFDNIVVVVMTVASFALLAVDWWNCYTFAVIKSGNVLYPLIFHLDDYMIPMLASVLAAISQIWFVDRAWRVVNKNLVFLVFCWLLIATSVATTFTVLIIGTCLPITRFHNRMMTRLMIVFLATGAAVDFLATAVLLYKVHRSRKLHPEASKKMSAISRITQLAFMTGSLTTVTAVTAGLVYHFTNIYSNAFVPFVDSIPRLCALSCIITLNARKRWREGSERSPNLPILKGVLTQRKNSTDSSLVYDKTNFGGVGGGRRNFVRDETTRGAGGRGTMLPIFAALHEGWAQARGGGAGAGAGGRTGFDNTGGRLHVSEIGTEGDLERALRYYAREGRESKGLSPAVESVDDYDEEYQDVVHHVVRPCLYNKRRSTGGSSGILVTAAVTRKVETQDV